MDIHLRGTIPEYEGGLHTQPTCKFRGPTDNYSCVLIGEYPSALPLQLSYKHLRSRGTRLPGPIEKCPSALPQQLPYKRLHSRGTRSPAPIAECPSALSLQLSTDVFIPGAPVRPRHSSTAKCPPAAA